MKQIIITSMKLTNFKGCRSFETDFAHSETEFCGENGTGKTTLFDAFCWVLYGKDSYGRSDTNFQLKTLDKENNVIERLPHEVTVTLCIDGEIVELRKTYTEVWKKKRGSIEETFDGHQIERFWNNVPMGERDFNQRISEEICAEDVFRLVTNPTHFLTQSAKTQRQFLLHLAGEVTPQTIIDANPKLSPLMEQLSKKTVEEYTKEVATELKKTKAEKDGLPARIDECKRSLPESENWTEILKQITEANGRMHDIDNALADKSKAVTALTDQRLAIRKEISQIESKIFDRAQEVQKSVQQDYWNTQNEISDIKAKIDTLKRQKQLAQNELSRFQDKVISLNTTLNTLREEYREIKSETFSVDENNLVCPTCRRPLEDAQKDQKIAEMEKAFNDQKARRQSDNMTKGISAKREREDTEKRVAHYNSQIEDINRQLADIMEKYDRLNTAPQTLPDASDAIKSDAEYKSLLAQKEERQKALDSLVPDVDDNSESQLRTQRQNIVNEISALQVRLAVKDQIERTNKRISELQKQYTDVCAEEVRLMGIQDMISRYKHIVIDSVDGSINSMFRYIKFKLYETQINGGEKEVCEALIDGVPYSTNVNTAGKVNAGLDFIKAVQKKYDMSVPVWIDNRESITELIPMDCQIINLVKDSRYSVLTRTI